MIVHVGSILHAYTDGRSRVEAQGETVAGVLDALERACPGLRFRVVDEQGAIRPHIRMFLGSQPVRDLETSVGSERELHILGALSGG